MIDHMVNKKGHQSKGRIAEKRGWWKEFSGNSKKAVDKIVNVR